MNYSLCEFDRSVHNNDSPPVTTASKICRTSEYRFVVLDRSWLACDCTWNKKAVACFAKSKPHCSQLPPCACVCLHLGHIYRVGLWHLTQYCTVPLFCCPHLLHCMVWLYSCCYSMTTGRNRLTWLVLHVNQVDFTRLFSWISFGWIAQYN